MQIFHLFGACGYVHSDRGKSFMSNEFVSFLHSLRIPTSNTLVYTPSCNGQCEKYNDILWYGIKLALKERELPISKWEVVLPQVLHSVRSLLCTTTNETPHERFFEFQRRSILGVSVPTWLSFPGTVYVRKHARQSKFEPQVEKADLIHATPQYARVRFGSGRETTVSLRDVAPIPDRDWPEPDEKQVSSNQNHCNDGNRQNNEDPNRVDREIDQPDSDVTSDKVDQSPSKSSSYEETHPEPHSVGQNELVLPRRSSRTRKPPDRLTYYH